MKSLFRRLFRRGEVLEVFDSELENELGSELAKAEDAGEFADTQEGDVPDSLGSRLEAAIRLRDQLVVQQEELLRESRVAEVRVSRTRELLERDERLLDEVQAAKVEADQWILERESSFAFRLLSRLNDEMSKLGGQKAQAMQLVNKDVDYDLGKLKKLVKRFVFFFQLSTYLPLGIYVLSTRLGLKLKYAIPLCVGLWILLVLLSLLSYHREWSRLSQKVKIAAAEVDFASELIPHTRTEEVRLRSLHPQVRHRIELVGETLYRPWVVSDDILNFRGNHPDADAMPAMFELAAVETGRDAAREAEIERRAVTGFVIRPGWRAAAYEFLLSQVEKVSNRPEGTLTADAVDRSPVAMEAVTEILRDSEAATMSGRERVRDIALQIQRNVLPEVRPLVAPLRTDPLQGLEIIPDMIVEPDADLGEWDEFMTAVIGRGSPWSTTTFSEKGKRDDCASKIRSFAYGPSRLQNSASDGVNYISTEDPGSRPLDLLVRIDLSDGFLLPEQVRIFTGTETSPEVEPERRSAISGDGTGVIT